MACSLSLSPIGPFTETSPQQSGRVRLQVTMQRSEKIPRYLRRGGLPYHKLAVLKVRQRYVSSLWKWK